MFTCVKQVERCGRSVVGTPQYDRRNTMQLKHNAMKTQCNYEWNHCELTIYSSTILNNCKWISNGRRSKQRSTLVRY